MPGKAQGILVALTVALVAAAPATEPANPVLNGEFEAVDPKHPNLPLHWTSRHPDCIRLVRDGIDPNRGMVVEMTGYKDLMATYGVDLVSDRVSFKPNTRYRCTGATRSTGPKMIVFVKGYATMTRKVQGKDVTTEEQVYQMKKLIDATPQWQSFNLEFDVRPANVFSDLQHKVEHLRITLWAYWPEGTCWFDDIRFEEVGPIPTSDRRHDQAVTHMGIKPRLATTQSSDEATFDEQQAWSDAVNAFNAGEHEQSLALSRQLLRQNADNADYHLLAARVLARLQNWDEAQQSATWIIDHDSQPWQRDWARVVLAECAWRANDVATARRLIDQVVSQGASEHAKQAALALLEQIHQQRGTQPAR